MYKAKVLVLGPCESGKSVICNFLSDHTETSGGDYHPTQGVRILEFEVNNVNVNGRSITADTELWDVSGDHKFEGCWPAISRDTNGVIFVYNQDQPNHDKELESWYTHFVDMQGLRASQCVIFNHQKPNTYSQARSDLPSIFNKIPCINTNIEEDGDALRRDFTNFLGTLLSAMSEKREQEELSIMNSR